MNATPIKRRYDYPLPILGIPLVLFFCAERTLTALDPANFSLAVKYGISVLAEERPHPPGYPLLVLLWRGISSVLHVEPHTAMIAMNGVFMMTAGAAAFYLAKRLYDAPTAFIACALLVVNPVFLYFGCTAETYTYDAAFSALAVMGAFLLGKKYLPWYWLAFGVAGGFRLSSVVLLFPVVVIIGLLRRDKTVVASRSIALYAALFLAGAAAWAVPLSLNEGGIQKIVEIIRTANESPVTFVQHNATFAVYLFWMVNVSGIIVVLRFRDAINSLKRKSAASLLLGVWIAVPLLYFIIAAYNKGYALIFLPAFAIASARMIYKMQKQWRYIAAICACACNLGIFFFMPFIPPSVEGAYSHANRTMKERIRTAAMRGISFYLPSLSHVAESEKAMREGIDMVQRFYDTSAAYATDESACLWVFPRVLQADFPALPFALPSLTDSGECILFSGDSVNFHYPFRKLIDSPTFYFFTDVRNAGAATFFERCTLCAKGSHVALFAIPVSEREELRRWLIKAYNRQGE